MMNHEECFKLLAQRVKPDDIVLPTYSTAFYWIDLRPSPLNYTSHGAMGLASSHGLGLALGRPDRRIIVLDGDGSLLMNLGSLVTIGNAAPKNFIHFVSENGSYEANGGHPIPGRDKISFAAMARAAGYRNAYEFSDLDALERDIDGILTQEGPVFVTLKITQGRPPFLDYERLLGPEARAHFREALHRSGERSA